MDLRREVKFDSIGSWLWTWY